MTEFEFVKFTLLLSFVAVWVLLALVVKVFLKKILKRLPRYLINIVVVLVTFFTIPYLINQFGFKIWLSTALMIAIWLFVALLIEDKFFSGGIMKKVWFLLLLVSSAILLTRVLLYFDNHKSHSCKPEDNCLYIDCNAPDEPYKPGKPSLVCD